MMKITQYKYHSILRHFLIILKSLPNKLTIGRLRIKINVSSVKYELQKLYIDHKELIFMGVLEEFIKSTHKVVENRPEPYGLFHIVFSILSIALIVGVCFLMRKNTDKTFRAVLFSVGAILILSEIYKQLYYYYAAGGDGYDWYIFPFQLCSVPMYISIAVGLMKKSRVRDAMCEYLVSIGFLGGIMAYLEPSGILNGHYFTLIHSCIWHALLIFIALYILFTGNGCNSLKDYRGAITVFGGVVVMATVFNIVFKGKPDFNMCYISPFYNTPLAVFKDFDVFFQGILGQLGGRIVSIIIYIIAVILGGFIIYIISYFVKRIALRKRARLD